jgi:hypothetical protein
MNSSRCRIGHATGKWLNPVPFGTGSKYKLHTDQELFDKAYGYIRQYY